MSLVLILLKIVTRSSCSAAQELTAEELEDLIPQSVSGMNYLEKYWICLFIPLIQPCMTHRSRTWLIVTQGTGVPS